MSAAPATAAKPAAIPRQPLSLRELFCLTTLAAITVAIVLYREWTSDERWLLGLTLGGTLVGILIARILGGQAAWGILGGMLSGGVMIPSIWSKGQESLTKYSLPTIHSATFQRWYFGSAIGATLLLSLGLAIAAVASYRMLVWGTDATERGFAATIRRSPIGAAITILSLVLLGLIWWHLDSLLNPRAWKPKYFIGHQRQALTWWSTLSPTPFERARFSHDGQWLSIVVRNLTPEGKDWSALHRLGATTAEVTTGLPELQSFSNDSNRLAYLRQHSGAIANNDSKCEVHIVDLQTLEDRLICTMLEGEWIDRLDWLPDGSITLGHDDGYVRLTQDADGKWQSHAATPKAIFDVNLGQRMEDCSEGLRVIDLASNREVARFPAELIEALLDSVAVDTPSISRDGRFAIAGDQIYDRQTHTVRTWEAEIESSRFAEFWFRAFTRGGHAVGTRLESSLSLYPVIPSWQDVPFLRRLEDRLSRNPICLIDPATGEEVARTQPLWSTPDDIAFSFDGSRMAVINLEGVYIYDVPAEFR